MLVRLNERANLIVGGSQFADWTSIWVQRTWGNPFDQFKFTCAEREGATASAVKASSQFKPGDQCRIELAGQLAMEGEIVSRQTAYDANSRGVQLQGTNQTWPAATSSVVHKTNSFDGLSFQEIVLAVLAPTGTSAIFKGEFSQRKLKYVHTERGETNFAFLERLAKNEKVIITCTKDGKFLFLGQNPPKGPQGELIEGRNILKMQCVVSVEQAYKKFIVSGQSNANNQLRYKPASQQTKECEGRYRGRYRTKIIPMEQPTTEDNTVETRCDNEQMWAAGTEINATVVVYGWSYENQGGPLWEPGSDVTVNSPMAMLNNQKMVIQSVTYTQDNTSGTLTTLVCVSENVLNGPKQNFAVVG